VKVYGQEEIARMQIKKVNKLIDKLGLLLESK